MYDNDRKLLYTCVKNVVWETMLVNGINAILVSGNALVTFKYASKFEFPYSRSKLSLNSQSQMSREWLSCVCVSISMY